MNLLKLDSFIAHHWVHSRRHLRCINCSLLPVLHTSLRTCFRNFSRQDSRLHESTIDGIYAGSNAPTFRSLRGTFIGQSSVWLTKSSSIRSTTSSSYSLSSLPPELPSNLSLALEEQLLSFLRYSLEADGHRQTADFPDPQTLIDINQECIIRAASWDFTTFMDFLRRYAASSSLDIQNNSSFMLYALNRRFESALDAPLPTLLEYLRILNNAKVWFKSKNSKHGLQASFAAHFDQMNWDEIDAFLDPLTIQHCIIFDDKLMKKICRKITDDFDNVSNVTMNKLFRLFQDRIAFPRNFLFITPWLLHILDAFVARIQSFDFECVVCAGQLCAGMFIHDPRLLQPIAETLLQRLRNLEPPQVARALSVLSFFNFQMDSRNLYSDIVQTMEEDEMFTKFLNKPRSLMRTLSNLSIVGVYSQKYLDVVFSDQFLRKLLGKKINHYRVTPEILILHAGTALECSDYSGPQLESKLFEYSLTKRTMELPKILRKHEPIRNVKSSSMSPCLNAPRDISTFYRTLYCTRGLLDELLGGVEYTHICFLLPQFKRATIIFGLNTVGKPIEISKDIRSKRIVGWQLLDQTKNWYAVCFKSHNIYTQNEPMLMGDDIAKDRQLGLCGFYTISITQHGWLKTSIEEKLQILKDEILKKSGVDVNVDTK